VFWGKIKKGNKFLTLPLSQKTANNRKIFMFFFSREKHSGLEVVESGLPSKEKSGY